MSTRKYLPLFDLTISKGSKSKIIAELRQNIEFLQKENARLSEDLEGMTDEIQRWVAVSQKYKKRIATLKKEKVKEIEKLVFKN